VKATAAIGEENADGAEEVDSVVHDDEVGRAVAIEIVARKN
jgi:hypothetical protein